MTLYTIWFDASTGDVKRWGLDPNPELNTGFGELSINAEVDAEPCEYRFDLDAGTLVRLPPTVHTATWMNVQQVRDRLLAWSAWASYPDAPIDVAQRAEINAYRQSLWNLQETFATPDKVVYPAAPRWLKQQ